MLNGSTNGVLLIGLNIHLSCFISMLVKSCLLVENETSVPVSINLFYFALLSLMYELFAC